MKAIGCDLLSLERFRRILVTYDEATLCYLFTANEFTIAKSSGQNQLFLSISFAGKEAVSKALGRGMSEMSWKNIEILPAHSGVGRIFLHQTAQELADSLRIMKWAFYWKIREQLLCVWVDAT